MILQEEVLIVFKFKLKFFQKGLNVYFILSSLILQRKCLSHSHHFILCGLSILGHNPPIQLFSFRREKQKTYHYIDAVTWLIKNLANRYFVWWLAWRRREEEDDPGCVLAFILLSLIISSITNSSLNNGSKLWIILPGDPFTSLLHRTAIMRNCSYFID